ncbi:hypothetical protein [Pedobacter helvus]|uniref:Uncharacterized protein n=1 Tax=Pedobacter helvus TaxID=2563444 RepID=A0ABW9JM02_9SPHI|nr:hypothetical protein [Pedobacter ureilyticus]
MEKQPFDETGLQSLLLALYALPDQQLTEESLALKHHPKMWINGHFELDQNQLDFLDQMPAATTNFLADQGSFAIANRLAVTLTKTYLPKTETTTGGDDQDKFFETKSNLASGTNNLGQHQASGTLSIEVTYSEQA